ncbi:MAG: hypothetical protein ACOYO1_10910 [Bacteroidales bacterium]
MKKTPLKIVLPVMIILIIIFYFVYANYFNPNAIDKTTESGLKIDNVSFDFLNDEDELIPAVAYAYFMKGDPMLTYTVTNNTNTDKNLVVGCEIPGWANPFENSITLRKASSRNVDLKLSFFDKLKQNNEISDAQVNYYIKENGTIIWNQSKSIKIAAKGTMLWSKEEGDDCADYIASFVNPNDVKVEEIISNAKEFAEKRQLIGYQIDDNSMQAKETTTEARAIFMALRKYGISYVNSPLSFAVGSTQRVRTPFESIRDRSANCIDGAVLFASLFENLGMEPLIILGPGHAIVGLRYFEGSSQTLFIETTMVGVNNEVATEKTEISEVSENEVKTETVPATVTDNLFEQACQRGKETFQQWKDNGDVRIIDIKSCRLLKIYPAFTN